MAPVLAAGARPLSMVFPVSDDPITLYVCTTCRPAGDAGEPRLGARVHERLRDEITARGLGSEIVVAPVECLSVCKRPATIAATGPDRWTYVYADVTLDTDMASLIEGLRAMRRAPNGITAWRERPESMRRGVVARIPPHPGASPLPVKPIGEDR